MDYTFVDCVITAIISAWVGAYVCWKINDKQVKLAKFFAGYTEKYCLSLDQFGREIDGVRQERNIAQADVRKYQQQLGAVTMQLNDVVGAYVALQAASQNQQVQTPTTDDTLAWKALLLACEELTQRSVEGRAQTTVEGWTDFFLNGAANGSAPS